MKKYPSITRLFRNKFTPPASTTFIFLTYSKVFLFQISFHTLYILGISIETMAKTKEQSKSGNRVKSEVKHLSKVKDAAVTKPSQTPIAKSKQIAKDVASKAVNGKKADKKSKKVTPPSSDEESDEESTESASSESDSEAEVEAKKPVAATNGKTNGNGVVKKQEVDSSDSSDSSSTSDSEASGSDSSDDEKSAAEDSDDSDDSDASNAESDEAAPVAAVAKNVVTKTVEAGKAAVNGAAKAVAKATVSTHDLYLHCPTNIRLRQPLMRKTRRILHHLKTMKTRKRTMMILTILMIPNQLQMKKRRHLPRNARPMQSQQCLQRRLRKILPPKLRILDPRISSSAT
jgi:hypothetical protein